MNLIFAGIVIIFLVVIVIYLYPVRVVKEFYKICLSGLRKASTIPGLEPADPQKGHLPDILAAGSLHEFLCKVHNDYGPVVSFRMGKKLYVSIASAELFAQQAHLFDRPRELFAPFLPLLGENCIQFMNGAEGRRRHAAYSKCFTPTAVKAYYTVYNKLSQDVVDKWTQWPAADFIPVMEEMFDYTMRNILVAGFGFKFEDEYLIKQIHASYDICMGELDRQFKGDIPDAGSTRVTRFNEHKDVLYKLMADAVHSRKELHHSSLEEPHMIIDAVLSLRLPESAMYSDLIAVFVGGFHAAASLLIWAIYFLALNPDIQERARKEVKEVVGDADEISAESLEQLVYLRQIVNETMRCAVLGGFACRVEDKEVTLGGHRVPAGTPVIHALGVSLHDPDIYPDPEKFDPERFSPENERKLPPYAFEPFGIGRRKCPGYRFSVAEATVLLAKLLRADLRLILAPDQVVTKKFRLVSLPADELWIRLELTGT